MHGAVVSDATAPLPAHALPPPRREGSAPRAAMPRSVRIIAWSILALFPLAVTVWAATIVLPIIIETREAAGEIFVTPAPREHFTTPVAVVPTAPGQPATQAPGAETPAPGTDNQPTHTPTTLPPGATPEPGATEAAPAEPTFTPTPIPPWDGKQPITVLLIGVDRREENGDDVGRSDTLIVVRVDPVVRRVDMVSIPRDLLVEIPGYYADKVNAAYTLGELNDTLAGGGPTLAAQTIEWNFGVFIDYFAEVDIEGLERIIDIIGGVVIDVPRIVKDDQYPNDTYGLTRVYFTPGLQRMNGETAVRYARTRHDDGDFARQSRQHEVLRAIRRQAESTGIITRLPDVIREIGDSLRTDIFGTLSLGEMMSLAQLGQSFPEDSIYSHSLLPYVSELWLEEGYYLTGDWTGMRALFADFASDPNLLDTTPTPAPSPTSTPEPSPTPIVAP